MTEHLSPIFRVADARAAAEWYRRIGFEVKLRLIGVDDHLPWSTLRRRREIEIDRLMMAIQHQKECVVKDRQAATRLGNLVAGRIRATHRKSSF
jgi:hypothetical protein